MFLDSRGSLKARLGFDEKGKPIPYWEVTPVGKNCGCCPKYDIETLLELIAHEEESK